MNDDLEYLLFLHRIWKSEEPCIPLRHQLEYNMLYEKVSK